MRQEVQWYLAEALLNARATMGLPDSGKRREGTFAAFSGMLGAFRYVEELSEDEERDWRDRMLVALGIKPPEPAAPGVSQAVYVGDPDATPFSEAARLHTPPRFVRSLHGPDDEFDSHGGRLRVLGVDLYDTEVAIQWRVVPQQDISAVFPAETAQLRKDVEGTDAWAAEHLRNRAEEGLRMMRLYSFHLADDVGSDYQPSGGGYGGGNQVMAGEATFTPAPPSAAATLRFTWLDLVVQIPLV